MASTSSPSSPVVPAEGHVNDVYGKLLLALDINEASRSQSGIEGMRELRFILRKFVYNLIELTSANCSEKDEYLEAAKQAAAAASGGEGDESVPTKASQALCEIIEDSPWELHEGVQSKDQIINVSLKGIKDGIKATISSIQNILEEDGTADLEYGEGDDDEEAAVQPPETPRTQQKRSSVAATPSHTPSKGQGNHSRTPGARWTDKENLEILRVYRDMQSTEDQRVIESQRCAEFHRRMGRIRAAQGEPAYPARTVNAFRLQKGKLAKEGTTFDGLSTALGIP